MDRFDGMQVIGVVQALSIPTSFGFPSVSSGGGLKRSMLFLAGLSLASLFTAKVQAASRWETLEAIHWVENPHDRRAAGPFGELGAYQFRPDTWKMHSSRPFHDALNRARSDEVAVKHYEMIKSSLERNGLEASTYNIALAWNAGISAAINGRAPAASHDYADRVTNISKQLGSAVATSQ